MQTNKRYWLKFGIWGTVVSVILLIVFTGAEFSGFHNYCVGMYVNPDGTTGSTCPPAQYVSFFNAAFNLPNIYFYILAALILFVLFSFIGWLYGKIKSKINKN